MNHFKVRPADQSDKEFKSQLQKKNEPRQAECCELHGSDKSDKPLLLDPHIHVEPHEIDKVGTRFDSHSKAFQRLSSGV